MIDVDQTKSSFYDIATKQIISDRGITEFSENTFDLQNKIIDKKYLILKLLGSGGMGHVYLAKQLLLNREVALKTFKSSVIDEEAKVRFAREAQAIAKLNHGNVVQIFDFATTDDAIPYYTMEFLSGESLRDRIKRSGALKIDDCISIFLQVLYGLSSAHQNGIVHRDMKPDNIFLTDVQGRDSVVVKIVDFGIAALTNLPSESQKLTQAGIIFGSPLYMSPEQSSGGVVTRESDIYSCGCALFECLTGRPPFQGPNAFSTLVAHQTAPIPNLKSVDEGSDFPPGLQELINSMLAKDAARRIQTADEAAQALLRISNQLKNKRAKPFGHQNESRYEESETLGYSQIGVLEANSGLSILSSSARPVHKKSILAAVLSTILLALATILYLCFGTQVPKTSKQSASNNLSHSEKVKTSSNTEDAILDAAEHLPIDDHDLKVALDAGKSTNTLKLRNRLLSDASFQAIANNSWLRTIILTNCVIDNQSLVRLSRLKLESLNLNESNLNNEGLQNILLVKSLKDLNVRDTHVTSAAIQNISSLDKLDRLTLAKTEIKDFDLQYIADLHVTYLDLGENPQLTNKSLSAVRNIPFWFIRLSGTDIDDEGLSYLMKAKDLCFVDLSDTKVTARGVQKLCSGKARLELVTLTGCQNLNIKDIQTLRAQFPRINFRIN